ncbi:MAG: DegT/DnrJ/EryC1/StrS family aminotransferase, partial [Legionellales bacterium]|nr:DegT/DnrJ/EryC1/StrS family aminotransferase [Legionellales bacterium]
VITAANGYIATALAITNVGATPVFVEPIENTYNIDPEAVKKAITPKTKVIIVTHLYGQTVNMEPFMNEISKKYNIKVFEDASQSHGAKYNDIPSGAIGHAAGFSLYPTKNLGAFGDAGIITSNDIEFINQVRMLRDYGQQVKYKNKLLGTNSRLDELQASFLLQKLKYLDSWNSRRVEIANIYLEKLKHIKEMILPYVPDFAEPVWHVFAIRVLNNKRENLMQHLEKNNIQYNIHYPIPIHLQECYKFLNSKKGSLPISERISNEILSLPIDPFHSNDEILYVINSIQNFFSK